MNETQIAFHIGGMGPRRVPFLMSLLAICQGNISQVAKVVGVSEAPASALTPAEDAATDEQAKKEWNAPPEATDEEHIITFLRANPKSSRAQIVAGTGMTYTRYHQIMIINKLSARLIKSGGQRGPGVRWSTP